MKLSCSNRLQTTVTPTKMEAVNNPLDRLRSRSRRTEGLVRRTSDQRVLEATRATLRIHCLSVLLWVRPLLGSC